jgi:hypothetical protein
MSVYVYSVFVMSCVQVAAFLEAGPPYKGPTDCVKDQDTGKVSMVQQRSVKP